MIILNLFVFVKKDFVILEINTLKVEYFNNGKKERKRQTDRSNPVGCC